MDKNSIKTRFQSAPVDGGSSSPHDVGARHRSPGYRANLEHLIIFRIGNDEFGIRAKAVKEIIKAESIAAIPDSPRFIKGIINVRGKAMITIDLRSRFFLQSEGKADAQHVVVTREEGNPFGLLVDEVMEFIRLPRREIKDVPGLIMKIHEEYVDGVIAHRGRMIVLLDLKRVLSEDELIRLSEIQRDHVPIYL
ncbi:MAG: purine-binding chemotaxis protein CheW [Deltaproteobacteria bacterium]|jgi:purine-binding chemotaxis protein CheW|nr:purine-binding chemotaxis protein CheW [Deltaproteobacteria bacterium]